MRPAFKIVHYIFVATIFCEAIQAFEVPSVHFQSDGLPSNESFIQFKYDIPQMDGLTVCVHTHLSHARDSIFPIVSYAVPDFSDEFLLYLDIVTGNFHMTCCRGNGLIETAKNFESIPILVWQHFCFIIDLKLLNYKIFVNDEIFEGSIISNGNMGLHIEGGGSLVLGQEQDQFNGGFSFEQSFEGILALFVISTEVDNIKDVTEFLSCKSADLSNTIVSFNDTFDAWDLSGSVEINSIDSAELCNKNHQKYIIFPTKKDLNESLKLCNKLKMNLVLPRNEFENDRISDLLSQKLSMCKAGWGVSAWIGVKASRISRNLWNYTSIEDNQLVNFTNFKQGYNNPVASYECIYYESFGLSHWIQYPCNFKTCVICEYTSPTILRFRGLCDDTNIDRYYVISGEYNGYPLFKGLSHSVIRAFNSTWELVDTLYPDIEGTMVLTEKNQNPIGLREWRVHGDKCEDGTLNLLLTACQAYQYTCDDGTCIEKMQRCDLTVDCPDQSDEILCIPVMVPSDYIKEVPPARIGTEAAPVSINLDILSLQPIDIRGLKVELSMTITLVWRDPRVNMESLNYDENMNRVFNTGELWTPDILFEDQYQSEAYNEKHWSEFLVMMESLPLADDITRVREDEVYPGSSNSLKLIESFLIRYTCSMNFTAYPFDTQNCNFYVRLKNILDQFVKFRFFADGVQYSGPYSIREYALTNISIFSDDKKNRSGIGIGLKLENLSGFYISTTYIPTFLMVAICYSTFFFAIDDFNDRIMVSLTALLVLATLFTQLTETTPKTSYMKLLDMWFVATIFIDFFIITILVTINIFKIKEDSSVEMTPVFSMKNKGIMKPIEKRKLSDRLNLYAKFVVPLSVGIFVMVYIIISQE